MRMCSSCAAALTGRQIEGAKIGYSQVYGAPGLSAVAILGA